MEAIKLAHNGIRGRQGFRKVWNRLCEEQRIARCTVERLSRRNGRATISDPALPCSKDKADIPDRLRVADFNHVQTGSGKAYSAFVIDIFARRIFGRNVPTSMATSFALNAFNQAIERRGSTKGKPTRYSKRGNQCLSFRYSARLADTGIETAVGSVDGSCGNAASESVIGLFKTGGVNHLGPRKSAGHIGWETPG